MNAAPTELNALLGFLPDEKENRQTIQVKSGTGEAFWRLDKKNGKNFFTLSVTKDDESPWKERYLPQIGDVISECQKTEMFRNATLLIPMRQCCDVLSDYISLSMFSGFVNLAKEHVVLVEVNLQTNTIQVHDSGGDWRNYFPDKLIGVAKSFNLKYDPIKDYHAYRIQKDHNLCAFFVNELRKSILENGDSSKCSAIRLDQENYETKYDYIRETLPSWCKETANEEGDDFGIICSI